MDVIMVDWDNKIYQARYGKFSVGSEESGYQLTVELFDESFSTLGDSMWLQNAKKFSTYDVDHDRIEAVSCSTTDGGKGGWWFMGTVHHSNSSCYATGGNKYVVYANGNGMNSVVAGRQGIVWANHSGGPKPFYGFKGSEYRITKISN